MVSQNHEKKVMDTHMQSCYFPYGIKNSTRAKRLNTVGSDKNTKPQCGEIIAPLLLKVFGSRRSTDLNRYTKSKTSSFKSINMNTNPNTGGAVAPQAEPSCTQAKRKCLKCQDAECFLLEGIDWLNGIQALLSLFETKQETIVSWKYAGLMSLLNTFLEQQHRILSILNED
jgi:hypothetical protein